MVKVYLDLGGAVFSSVNSFLQHNASRDGYARQNRYEVVIGLPTGVNGSSQDDAGQSALSGSVLGQLHGEAARRISFRCDSISMPGRALRTQVNVNIYGPQHEMTQGVVFSPVQASFYCGSDMAERYFFEEWQKISYNPRTYNINYYKEYTGRVEIYHLNEQDERQYGIVLTEVFPKTISEQQYGHGTSNTIQKVTVEFAYRYWRNLGTEPERGTNDSNLADLLKNAVIRKFTNQIPMVIKRLF